MVFFKLLQCSIYSLLRLFKDRKIPISASAEISSAVTSIAKSIERNYRTEIKCRFHAITGTATRAATYVNQELQFWPGLLAWNVGLVVRSPQAGCVLELQSRISWITV
jgi:hypothetical protein